MRTPLLVRLVLTHALLLGGIALAEPTATVGGALIEITIDLRSEQETTSGVDDAIKLLEAVGDFACKLFACSGTGAPQPGGGGGGGDEQPPIDVESILPIPDDWRKDPRFVTIAGRLAIGDATAWLEGIRVVRSTFEGDAFLIEFEPFATGQELYFMTFHQPYVLPDAILAANRLDGPYVVPAGTYTVDGTSLKIAVTRMR